MNWKLVILALFLVLIVWAGYVIYAVATLQPTVRASWGYVDEKTTEIWIEAKLNKPLLVPADIENLSMKFMGITVAEVKKFSYGATSRDVSMAIAITNPNLVRALVEYLDNGQSGTVEFHLSGKLLKVIPINANIQEGISENILSYLNFTAESREILGGLAKTPALVETTFDWAGEENGKAVLIAHMKFYNPNEVPIPVGNLSFEVYANDMKIGYGRTTNQVVIPAKGYATLDIRTYIVEESLPKVWEVHVKNGEVSRVKANIYLDFKIFGKPYSIKLVSYEETVRTDIIGGINRMLEEMLR